MAASHRQQYLEFVARLRRARKTAGLTQDELASTLGKPQSYVSKVETCERRLDVIEAAEWCVALGVTLGSLLPAGLRSATDGAAAAPKAADQDASIG